MNRVLQESGPGVLHRPMCEIRLQLLKTNAVNISFCGIFFAFF